MPSTANFLWVRPKSIHTSRNLSNPEPEPLIPDPWQFHQSSGAGDVTDPDMPLPWVLLVWCLGCRVSGFRSRVETFGFGVKLAFRVWAKRGGPAMLFPTILQGFSYIWGASSFRVTPDDDKRAIVLLRFASARSEMGSFLFLVWA